MIRQHASSQRASWLDACCNHGSTEAFIQITAEMKTLTKTEWYFVSFLPLIYFWGRDVRK